MEKSRPHQPQKLKKWSNAICKKKSLEKSKMYIFFKIEFEMTKSTLK